ncbi:uncharacterized protein METZ01_LOCUS361248 [marine metagenome]|uniref:Uncharacterized protein n=1 Tax=marine metagenome TaxID=408172 RepID=A0A382SER8_9ZZZZ
MLSYVICVGVVYIPCAGEFNRIREEIDKKQ